MSDATGSYILCVLCRGTFTDEEIGGHSACPRCGNRGVPADTRKTGTATLTAHEWRILCIWAEQWAAKCAETEQEGHDAQGTIQAIVHEIRRQAPDLPALTLRAELQEVSNAYGRVELHRDGKTETFEPQKKN